MKRILSLLLAILMLSSTVLAAKIEVAGNAGGAKVYIDDNLQHTLVGNICVGFKSVKVEYNAPKSGMYKFTCVYRNTTKKEDGFVCIEKECIQGVNTWDNFWLFGYLAIDGDKTSILWDIMFIKNIEYIGPVDIQNNIAR